MMKINSEGLFKEKKKKVEGLNLQACYLLHYLFILSLRAQYTFLRIVPSYSIEFNREVPLINKIRGWIYRPCCRFLL